MIALDIGAGDLTFSKQLYRLNPGINQVFAGEPNWLVTQVSSRFQYLLNLFSVKSGGVLSEDGIDRVLKENKSGVFRILAKYTEIPFDDNSLDIVTLNSPNPYYPVRYSGFREIERVLKPNGLLFCSYSANLENMGFPADYMKFIGDGKIWIETLKKGYIEVNGLFFPISDTIRDNIIALYLHRRGMFVNTNGKAFGFDPSNPCKPTISPSWGLLQKS